MDNKLIKYCCAFIFSIFSFCYLYFYQADIMQLAQHVASSGQTYYHPWLGAILITLTLQLLQIGINSVLKLTKRGFALTYCPSAFLLAMLTSVNSDMKTSISFGVWVRVLPIFLIVYIGVISYVKRYEPYEPDTRSMGLFSQLIWINIGTMLLLLLFVGGFGNSNLLFHQRAKIEALVKDRDYKGALTIVKKMEKTDSTTTMLTLYALAREQKLQEETFEYLLVGGSKVMRPKVVHSILTPDSIINKSTKKSVHYQLIGFLLDKNKKKFMAYLPLYYPVDSLRPRYYKEAFHLFKTIEKGGKLRSPYPKGSYTKYYYES